MQHRTYAYRIPWTKWSGLVIVASGEVLACFRLRGGLSGKLRLDCSAKHCALLSVFWVSVHSLCSSVTWAHSIGAPCCQRSRWSECTRSTKVVGYLSAGTSSHLLNVISPTQQLSRPLDVILELWKAKCANHRLNF